MNIPVFTSIKCVEADGFYTNEMNLFEDELNRSLIGGLSDNGWTVPQQTTAKITELATMMPDGTIWYCTDHTPPVFVGLIAGVLVQFTTAAFP